MSDKKKGEEFDQSIYGSIDKSQYLQSLPDDNEDEEEDENYKSKSINHMKIGDIDSQPVENGDSYRENYGSGLVNTRISDRENEVNIFIRNSKNI
jgi:hypothetical protein